MGPNSKWLRPCKKGKFSFQEWFYYYFCCYFLGGSSRAFHIHLLYEHQFQIYTTWLWWDMKILLLYRSIPPPFCGIIVLYIISITSPINVTKPTIIIVIIITLIILCLLKKLRAERRASINLWISMYSDSQLPLQELSNIARTEVSPNFRGISWSSSSACWPSSSFTC